MILSWQQRKYFTLVNVLVTVIVLINFISSSFAFGTDNHSEELKKVDSNNTIKTLTNQNPIIKNEKTGKNSINENRYLGEQHELQNRAFRSSGNVWKTASKMITQGLRVFREKLLEGAKVAHMFREDFDEGMSSIMRQNRGVKVENTQQEEESSTSFFDSQMLREGVLGGILRFMGINSKQVGVIALNCLIIVAEWITSSMVGKSDMAGVTSRMVKTNLLEWASTGHNTQIQKLLMQARSHSLPEKLIDSLGDKTGNTTSCVQLLICKMTPVIWGFQDTVKDQWKYTDQQPNNIKIASRTEKDNNTENIQRSEEPRGLLASSQYYFDKFLGHLPEKERIMNFGDRCETKFPHCKLLKFNSVK